MMFETKSVSQLAYSDFTDDHDEHDNHDEHNNHDEHEANMRRNYKLVCILYVRLVGLLTIMMMSACIKYLYQGKW